MIPSPAPPPEAPASVPPPTAKKPLLQLHEEYEACLLGEIIAYQAVVKSYQQLTNAPVISSSLKAAKGATDHAKELLAARQFEERAAEKPGEPPPV